MGKTKKLPAEERKKLILKCAVKVFAQSNYRTAKMADIAKAAGVSEAMVYKYFSSKKDIFLRILKHMSDRIATFWQEEVEKESDPLRLLKNMGMAYYKRMIKHPDELKVQFQAISEIDDNDIAERLRKDHALYIDFFEGILKRGIQQGRIRRDAKARQLAFVLNGAGIVLNMMRLLSFDGEISEDAVSEFLEEYIGYIRA
jgi:TetR/AcrR family transcriptional regulator